MHYYSYLYWGYDSFRMLEILLLRRSNGLKNAGATAVAEVLSMLTALKLLHIGQVLPLCPPPWLNQQYYRLMTWRFLGIQ